MAKAKTVTIQYIGQGSFQHGEWVVGSGEYIDIPEKDYKFLVDTNQGTDIVLQDCLLYTSPSPRDATLSRMPSSA